MPRARGSGKGIVEKRVTVKGRTRIYVYARVRYTDERGKSRAMWRRAANRTDAADVRQRILAELKERKARSEPQPRERVTFGELATSYAAASLIPAEYRDGRKIAGRRRPDAARATLARLCEHFGATAHPTEPNTWTGGTLIEQITFEDLDALRLKLHETPARVRRVERGRGRKIVREWYEERPRTIATVNRALGTLRHMLNIAARRGWITVNPFARGDRPLISTADEVIRKRLLTFEEEARLYEQCTGKRAHLRAIIMCALDTAMREGEIFKLRVSDVRDRQIVVRQENTKTLRERVVPVSRRLQNEIDRLLERKLNRPDDLLFGVTTVKRSFAGACRDAGIEGLRFHDLRRTAATRLHRGVPESNIQGMPIAEIARLLGHAQITTTFRYLAADDSTITHAADLIDQINAVQEQRSGSTGLSSFARQ
ncbi:MAG TPA: site-specific integrase [Pyrinomonadaceae bacterium]|nr:site-specific integrase [Pyrinomonadaceae bacterium]